MKISRRNVLQSFVAAGAGAWLGDTQSQAALADSRPVQQPLIIPALDAGVMKVGERGFNLAIQAGRTEFFPGRQTPTLGVNGAFLGQTLRCKAGDRVTMHVRSGKVSSDSNQLAASSAGAASLTGASIQPNCTRALRIMSWASAEERS